MYKFIFNCPLILFFFISCQNQNNVKIKPENLTEDYFGTKLDDSFRFLENDTVAEIKLWYKKNNLQAKNQFEKIPGRDEIYSSIIEIENLKQTKISDVKKADGNRYFYLQKKSSELISKLYCRNLLNGEETLIYDPVIRHPNKSGIIINYFSPNKQGTKIAFSITENDKEVAEIRIFDLEKNTLLPEIIQNCAPSILLGIKWLKDGNGFSYMHIPDINPNSKNYFLNTKCVLYKLGEDSKKLNVLFSRNKYPNLNLANEDYPIIEYDGEFAFTGLFNVSPFVDYYYTNYNDAISGKSSWKPFYTSKDKITHFFTKDDKVIFMTAKNASNFKICEAPLGDLSNSSWKTLVEEDDESVITDLALTKHAIYFIKTKNGVESRLYRLETNGVIKEIYMPHSGVAHIYSYDTEKNHLFLGIEGWTFQYSLYELDYKNDDFKLSPFSTATEYDDLNNVVVKEIEISSHDGVMVPLSIIHSKNMTHDNSNRVLMVGYGAYGYSETPYLNKVMLQWIKNGGIYAMAHVRGGGEKGDKWHKGGFKSTKSNTWKDFIACAEYLIDSSYTQPDKLVISGTSAGGIPIGRAITERPGLFCAAMIRSGILNTTRSQYGVAGESSTYEFGTVNDSIEFLSLLEMDAYQHIKYGTKYPAVYASVGLKDARVSPWETAKFIAKLRNSNISKKSILFSIDKDAGHGLNLTSKKRYNEWADQLTFALWQTGHPDFQPLQN